MNEIVTRDRRRRSSRRGLEVRVCVVHLVASISGRVVGLEAAFAAGDLALRDPVLLCGELGFALRCDPGTSEISKISHASWSRRFGGSGMNLDARR